MKWEYTVSKIDAHTNEILNEWGRDGWELVSVVPDPWYDKSEHPHVYLFLKRALE